MHGTDLGWPHSKLVAFSAHVFYEDGNVQCSTAADCEGV